MKRIIFTIMMLVCLSGLVKADGEYLDSSCVMIDQVRINLNLSHINETATDSIIMGYIYDGAIVSSAIAQSITLIDTLTTSAYNHILAYDTLLESIDDVVFFSRDSIKQVKWKDRDDWDDIDANNEYLNNTANFSDRLPTHYDWDNGYLFLYPVPVNTGDSLLIVGHARPDNIILDSLFVRDIRVAHRPAIVYYATSMLALRLGLANEAQAWELKYNNYIGMINATKQKITEVPTND